MRLRCRLGLHDFDYRHERVRLRGRVKVTVLECKHCGVRRGFLERVYSERLV